MARLPEDGRQMLKKTDPPTASRRPGEVRLKAFLLSRPAMNRILLVPIDDSDGILRIVNGIVVGRRQEAEAMPAYHLPGLPCGTAHFTIEFCLGH